MPKTIKSNLFHEPPIQKWHWGYALALQLVRAGVTRFHRIERVDGLEHITSHEGPTIFVANHQNGLMDPLVLCALIGPQQIHWLTRADIFNNRITRALMFGFNQMPIFRQRDRVADARERNVRIFEICAQRMKIGASIGLFPEGNHRALKSLRPMRRGVNDMVNQALALGPEMRKLRIIPVGIDYEEMTVLRRRLSYRIGAPIPFEDLINPETGQIEPGSLLTRIEATLKSLMVDIQPIERYDALLPYVQAMRTTESTDWNSTRQQIERLASFEEEAFTRIVEASVRLHDSKLLERVRAEDLGHDPADLRPTNAWIWALAPLAVLGGLISWPFSKWIGHQAHKRVKDPCFVSTFKVSVGMFLFPLYWFVLAWPMAYACCGSWGGWPVLGMYLFNLVGSRIAGWWYGHFQDWQGRRVAKRVWEGDGERPWSAYVAAVQNALNKQPMRSTSKTESTPIS